MNKETELLKNYLEMCSRMGCDECPLSKSVEGDCIHYILNNLDEAAEVINNWAESQKKKTGWERAKLSKSYWTFEYGEILERNDTVNDNFYQVANYFTSIKLFNNIKKFQTICRKIFRWIAENDPNLVTKEDKCNTGKTKYGIGYDYDSKCIRAFSYTYIVDNSFVLSNEKTANDLVETFKEELTWLFTEFEFFDGGEIND